MSIPTGEPHPEPTTPPVQPPVPFTAPPPPVPPASGQPASPHPPVPATAGGPADPLVPAGQDFSSWFATVQQVARRSWRSALFTAGLGIGIPLAAVTLVRNVANFTLGLSLTGVGDFFADVLGSLLIGAVVSLVAAIAAAWVASAAWAAGTWALVQEAATGQPANLGEAWRYGLSRAFRLWPWAVLAGAAFYLASACLWLPGVYVAFGMSMFGFVGIFERGQNPIGRSFSLTHRDVGPSLGKILLGFVPYFVLSIIIAVIFGAIALAIAFGTRGGFVFNVSYGIVAAIGQLLLSVGYATLLLALLPTYAQLRSREAPISTAQLRQEGAS